LGRGDKEVGASMGGNFEKRIGQEGPFLLGRRYKEGRRKNIAEGGWF